MLLFARPTFMKLYSFLPLSFSILAAEVGAEGFVVSSLEQYSFQVGPDDLELRSYDGFDDIDGFDDVTGLTLSINGGTPEAIPFSTFYEAFKRGKNYDTLEEMLAERPIGATYTHTLSGTPSGSVTIASPNLPYAQGIPVDPVFTVSGATGVWVIGPNGVGKYYFNPDSVTDELTVTMNAYSAPTQGGHSVYGVFVNDITTEFENVGEYSSDLVADGEESPVPEQLVLTFTKDDPVNGGDGDPSTFGFSSGTRFEIEGEHVNIFGLSDSGLGQDVALKAFVYQTVTAFELLAVWPPASEFPIATDVEVDSVAMEGGEFMLNWRTTPDDAAVNVYKGTDLGNLGSWERVPAAIRRGSWADQSPPDGRGFYMVVPAASPWPPGS